MVKGRTLFRTEASASGPKLVSALSVRKRQAPKPNADGARCKRRTETPREQRKTKGGGDLHIMATKKKAKKPAKKAAKKKK